MYTCTNEFNHTVSESSALCPAPSRLGFCRSAAIYRNHAILWHNYVIITVYCGTSAQTPFVLTPSGSRGD